MAEDYSPGKRAPVGQCSGGGRRDADCCLRVCLGAPAAHGVRFPIKGVISGMERLEDLLKNAEGPGPGPAPVERWDPPYCGDIGLAISRDGRWHYRGSPIQRPAMVKLFARVLRRDADGRTYLVTPVEKVDVAVEDAPFLAVEMQTVGAGGAQALLFRTNVDDVVRCGPEHPLRFVEVDPGGGLKPYVHVRGRLEALVTRALVYDLVALAVDGAEGTPGIWSDGAFFPLPG